MKISVRIFVHMKSVISLLAVLFAGIALHAQDTLPQEMTAATPQRETVTDTLVVEMKEVLITDSAVVPPLPETKAGTVRENKKLIAAICAFPPFGLFGLHRIYLHSAPYVPVVYLCTLGGAGVLTMIDFVVILLKTPEEINAEFENNDKIFMWVK